MAQESYRFAPVFLGGSWWRLEFSWRSHVDDQHFAEEWTATIPPASPPNVWFSISSIRLLAKNDAELLAVDRVSIEIEDHAKVLEALSTANESTDARLWWSADGVSWVPLFWGIVDLDDLAYSTAAVVSTTWIKTVTFQCYDSLLRLKNYRFRDTGNLRLLDISYQIDLSGWDIMIGGYPLESIVARYGTGFDDIVPSSNGAMRALRYYLEIPARLVFDEQYLQSPAAPLAMYGFDPANPVAAPVSFVAETSTAPTPSTIENDHEHAYIFYDAFSTEWADDIVTWADAVAEFALSLGLAVRTRHTLESGRWVRSLQYLRLDGQNGMQVSYAGALMRDDGALFRRVGRQVTATTRFFEGGHRILDVVYGSGEEKSVGLHFRTMGAFGALNANSPVSGGGAGTIAVDRDKARNILWGACAVADPVIANRVHIVTHVKIGSIVRPASSRMTCWNTVTLEQHPGWAQALAVYLSDEIMSSHVLQKEVQLNSIRAYNPIDTTDTPANWSPLALMQDDEVAGQWRITQVDISPNDGTVTVTKESL